MKTPLVLISGLLSNERIWQHSLSHLKDVADIHCVSPSQNTPKKMVEAILKSAPKEFALAGHSMGGWLALEIMRVAPNRVLKLCLLNTTARSDTKEKQAKRKEMIAKVKTRPFEELIDEIAPAFVYNKSLLIPVKKMFMEVGKQAFIQQEESMLQRKESESILPSIDCRALVIHAAQDKIFTFQEHEEMVSNIRGATLVVIEDSGHMSPLEKPEVVTHHLRNWLINF